MNIRNIESINTNKLYYNDPFKNGNEYLSKAQISQNNNEEIILINEFKKNFNNISKKYIKLGLDPNNKYIYKFLSDIDDHNIKTAYLKSLRWFKNQLTLDTIDDFYKQIINIDANMLPFIKCICLDDNIIDKYNKSSFNSKLNVTLRYKGLKFLKQQFTGILEIINIEEVKELSSYMYMSDSDDNNEDDAIMSSYNNYKVVDSESKNKLIHENDNDSDEDLDNELDSDIDTNLDNISELNSDNDDNDNNEIELNSDNDNDNNNEIEVNSDNYIEKNSDNEIDIQLTQEEINMTNNEKNIDSESKHKEEIKIVNFNKNSNELNKNILNLNNSIIQENNKNKRKKIIISKHRKKIIN